MTLRELKDSIKNNWRENPSLYNVLYGGEEWIHNILKMPASFDDREVYAEWVPTGISNEGGPWFRLSNFAFL